MPTQRKTVKWLSFFVVYFTPTDKSAGDPGRLNSRGGTRRRSSPGSPSPVSCPSSLEKTKKDSHLTVFLCVGITYLPGPSPSKYFRHKWISLLCSIWEQVDHHCNQHLLLNCAQHIKNWTKSLKTIFFRLPTINIGQVLDLLVSVGWVHYCTYTSDLSTL